MKHAEDPDRFIQMLDEPLPGDTSNVVSQRTIDDENESFARFMAEAGRM